MLLRSKELILIDKLKERIESLENKVDGLWMDKELKELPDGVYGSILGYNEKHHPQTITGDYDPKVGDRIRITSVSEGYKNYFKIGDEAILVSGNKEGSWLVDFSINEIYVSDGRWFINGVKTTFELIEHE